jgi:uncharacterized protein YecT (DUF1311 family)
MKLDAAHAIYLAHLEYYDFLGDGNEEAIVVASTCMTGTAGPDVHAVYRRDAAGNLVELPFDHKGPDNPFSNNTHPPVFGNRNYTLRVENGLLAERWSDTSDREVPLIIWYKWKGAAFVVDSVKQTGPFKTSYDCGKATQEVEQAICYSVRVSALDVELGALYGERLRSLPPDERAAFREWQRAWLAQRNKCVIYKWWVECLSELYRQRITELREQTK